MSWDGVQRQPLACPHCPRRKGLTCLPPASLVIRVNVCIFEFSYGCEDFGLVWASMCSPNTMVLDHDPEAIITLVLIKYVHME